MQIMNHYLKIFYYIIHYFKNKIAYILFVLRNDESVYIVEHD